MSVVDHGDAIRLVGDCDVADAEPLTAALASDPGRAVDFREAGAFHGAVVQALLAHRPPTIGPAGDAFVEDPAAARGRLVFLPAERCRKAYRGPRGVPPSRFARPAPPG